MTLGKKGGEDRLEWGSSGEKRERVPRTKFLTTSPSLISAGKMSAPGGGKKVEGRSGGGRGRKNSPETESHEREVLSRGTLRNGRCDKGGKVKGGGSTGVYVTRIYLCENKRGM